MLQVLIGLIIIAAIVVGGLYIFQKTTTNRVNDIKAKKYKLVELHVERELESGSKMSLTGESLEEFKQLQTGFDQIRTEQFNNIDELADEIYREVKGVNVIKTQSDVKMLDSLVTEAQHDVTQTRETLNDFKKIDQKHRQAVSKLEKKYQALRKQLLSQNFKFGDSIDSLEDQLSTLEDEFDKFSTLTTNGDHISAKDILAKLELNTNHLENLIKVIPDLYHQLESEYTDQLDELKSGYDQLVIDNFNFKDANIATEINNIETQRVAVLAKLSGLDVDAVKKANESIERQIDHLYELMQIEIDARPQVTEIMPQVSKFIIHAQNQNHELMLELDRLGQNYTLDHGELETARGLGEQIKQLEKDYQNDLNAIENKSAIDSSVLEQQQEALVQLEQIEKQQTEINDDVDSLQSDEHRAKETLRQFAIDIHAIKRHVESLNLPGLPKSYLEYFFVVSDEIKKLDSDINKIKINMEDITKQLLIVQSDLETLEEKTNDVKDSAQLAERLLQYANRLREDNVEVEVAVQKAQKLFDESYDYSASLETIATVLDKVEPGSYKRLEDNYYGK
ncbi:septation ring formation regulator EzrA [Paucilactobacillus oligofermentans DSM 15707 = LMG 22743]|uniref:Septation ring formation regulator EzrA n=1 Tax=Paucilactobacillus oligofermentans DSM 15707 = LMG 22743 TaxID=1423778 RepID=A0A0R1RRV6_9LACO|nr:septation ring formation regulator EzrA [Paucilactobacillus oligofermentans]KRL57940.1 septation ring formation regulator EzrA [Paucilactobacillus oligofermentans DSM 15707 = LMG 22743]CUS26588.1 Septation ring formation regulator EzrA [Paucilactobacillus oligofermentans DSM 15707 = LMG 22743]